MPRSYFRTPEERFLGRTEPLLWSGCLIWTGAVSEGYGRMVGSDGELVYAHRWAWEQEHGPIPDSLVLDHWLHCSTLCCEPSHLRLATRRQNNHHRAGPNKDNRVTGVLNVYLRPSGRYAVMIETDGKTKGYGTFDTIAEAVARRDEVRRAKSGSFAGRNIA